jgi:PAS domain S-box-containing protein
LCKQIEQVRHIPFVFYTSSYTSDKDEQFALSLGANAFIRKPADPETLARVIVEVCEKAKSGLISPPEVAALEPSLYYAEYSERLTTKLDKKVAQLEREATERQQAQEELRESEEKLQLIFESISDGIVVSDLEGQIMDANEAAVRLLGYSDKVEVIGRIGFEFIAEKDRARATEDTMKGIELGYGPAYEYTFVNKDGREYQGEASASLLRDSSGNPVGFVSVARDITERRRAEEEKLQAITERAAVIDAMGDGLITIGMDGKILSMNPALQRLSGYTEDEFINKDAASLIPRFIKPEEQERLSDIFGATLKGDIPESATFTLLDQEG